MKPPEKCPVCGSRKLQKIALNGKLTRSVPPRRNGPQSYRCENGHTFLLPKKDSAASAG